MHYRVNGLGYLEHAHRVDAEIHGHDGLRSVRLGWAVYRWTYVAAHVLSIPVTVGAAVLPLLALWVLWWMLS